MLMRNSHERPQSSPPAFISLCGPIVAELPKKEPAAPAMAGGGMGGMDD